MGTTTDKKDEDVNRLHDMLVHEVSVVDRAANGTTFLLLKRDDKMGTTGAEVVEQENGDLTTVGDTTPPAPAAPVAKVEFSLAKDLKEKLQASTTEALKRLTDVAVAVKALPDEPDGGGLPGELAMDLVSVLELLINGEQTTKGVFIDNTTKASALRMLGESMERLGAVVTSVKNATEGEEAEAPAELTSEISAIAHLVGGVIERHAVAPEPEPTRTEKSMKVFQDRVRTEPGTRMAALAKAASTLQPVEKAGAKMSASRVSKLKDVISQLMALLADVDSEVVDDLLGKVSDKAKGKKPKKGEGTKPYVAKVDEAAIAKAAADATKVDELTAQVKTLSAQVVKKDAELARLSKSVAMPNSMVVEHAPSASSSNPVGPVGWPSDMNNPVSKETIKKEHWFEGKE